MPDFGLLEASHQAVFGPALGSTALGVAPAGSSTNAKGSWVEVVSAANNAHGASWVMVDLSDPGAASRFLVDVALGASGSEVVAIADLLMSGVRAGHGHATYLFPVAIPPGVRVAVRAASSASASSLKVAVRLFSGAFASLQPLGGVTTFGADAADTSGVTVDPGAAANTKGSWVQLSATVPYPIRWLALGFANLDTSWSTTRWLLDIGVGAAGSEVVVVPDLPLSGDVINDHYASLCYSGFPVSVAAGARLAARCASSSTVATERNVELVAYGVS